nr:hypothetical protein [Providencia alcalifaciens]
MRIQGDTWKDVGAYNAGLKKTEQEQKRHRYANEVYNIYLALKKMHRDIVYIHQSIIMMSSINWCMCIDIKKTRFRARSLLIIYFI